MCFSSHVERPVRRTDELLYVCLVDQGSRGSLLQDEIAEWARAQEHPHSFFEGDAEPAKRALLRRCAHVCATQARGGRKGTHRHRSLAIRRLRGDVSPRAQSD